MIVARQELLAMLAEKSFRLGDFKLSSGGTSDYYIDCRATTLDANGARLTARTVVDELYRRGWVPQGIGGMTLGADPIVVSVAMLTAQQVQSRHPDQSATESPEAWLIHAFIVRKGDKGHGTGQRIEGFRAKGAAVVIVDDVCTTGASTVQAIEAAREFGFEVIGVMCLVEREDAGGRANVEQAAAPAPFVSIYTAAEIREEHLRLKKVQQAHAEK
ncbi:MAG: orotate phosphoribosyltransferase [Terriglobales bacterium]